MHKRLLIRCAAVVLLGVAATPLAIDSGQPDVGSRSTAGPRSLVNDATRPAAEVQAKAEPGGEIVSVECDEEGDATWPPLDLQSTAGRQAIQEALAPLGSSTNPEHLFALALAYWRDDLAKSLALLSQALVYVPDNPLLLVNLGEACRRMPGAAACTAEDVEAHVLRVGGSNGAVWARVAAWRHRRGDRDGALDALRRAATAPAYDAWTTDHFLLLERALAASTDYSYAERVYLARAMPGMGGSDIELLQVCADETHSAEWRQACVAFGVRLEADADFLIAVMVGIELQGAMQRANGDFAELTRTEGRRQQLHELMWGAFPIDQPKAVMYGDEELLAEYVTELTGHGELSAMRYLKQVLASRASPVDADPCR